MGSLLTMLYVIYLLIFKVTIPFIKRLILIIAFLLRHDEHPLDTEEWLNRQLGIEPPDEADDESDDPAVLGKPHHILDVVIGPAPNPPVFELVKPPTLMHWSSGEAEPTERDR